MADRSVEVRLRADISNFVRGMATASAATKGFAKNLETADSRMGNFTQSALALGPSLVPIGAVAVPAIAGLAAQLGFAATAAGVSVLAFQGVGGALEALNAYQLEPTQANLEKMNEAMATLGPAGQDFVRTLQDLRPEMQGLQDIAQAGLFPGLTDGINEMLDLMPQAENLIGTVATTLGNLASEAGDNLSDPRWVEFFEFLDAEAAPTLEAMGKSFGNVVEGLANLMMAADPLSDLFTGGLLDATRDFREWTEELDSSDGFRSFVDYIRDNGPQAMQTLGAIGMALVSLVEAAAPVGAATLPLLEALAKTLSAVAESPAGPALILAASGLSAVSRSIALFKVANGSALMGLLDKAGGKGTAAGVGLRAAGAGIGVLALSLTDLDEKAGLSNTAMFALMGTVAGPWGAAAGGAIGLTMDLASANDDLESAVERVQHAFEGTDTKEQTSALRALRDEIQGTKDDLSSFVVALGSGDVFQAAEGFGDGAKAAFLSLTGAVGGADEKLRTYQQTVQGSSGLDSLMIESLGGAADAFHNAALSADEFREAAARALGLLDKRASLRAAREAIRAFNQEMEDSPKHMRKGSAAFDEAEDALDNIARSSLEAAEHLRGMGRVNFLDKQRDQFIGAARALGMTRNQAAALADQFGLLDKQKVKPKIDADEKPAKHKIDSVDSFLRDLVGKDYTAHIDGETSGVDSAVSHARSALMALAGTTVTTFINTVRNTFPGGHADGGLIHGPGGPRDDRIPAMLSNGEFVVNAASARRNLPLLFTMNRQKFADGGMAGDSTWRYSARGGHHGMDDADHAARSFAQRLKDAQKELEKETSQRKDLISNMKSFKSDVAGSFDHDPFGNGLAGLDLQLSADRNDAQAMKRALSKAKKKGLDGGLFAALAASGDLNTAQQLAGLSKGQIRAREKLFAQTNAAQGALGQFAANEKFGDAMKESAREIKHLHQVIDRLEKRLPKAVEAGARAGVGDQGRRAHVRSRTGG